MQCHESLPLRKARRLNRAFKEIAALRRPDASEQPGHATSRNDSVSCWGRKEIVDGSPCSDVSRAARIDVTSVAISDAAPTTVSAIPTR